MFRSVKLFPYLQNIKNIFNIENVIDYFIVLRTDNFIKITFEKLQNVRNEVIESQEKYFYDIYTHKFEEAKMIKYLEIMKLKNI